MSTLYKKVGRRYVPVAEYSNEVIDSFPKGTHLVMCYPGGQSRRFNIDPAYAPMIAAGRVAEDAISRVIMEHSQMRVPEKERPLTEKQRKAWQEFSRAMGKEMYALEYCSYREAAEAGVRAMQEEANQLMTHESVKKAWNHFQLVCELTREQTT